MKSSTLTFGGPLSVTQDFRNRRGRSAIPQDVFGPLQDQPGYKARLVGWVDDIKIDRQVVKRYNRCVNEEQWVIFQVTNLCQAPLLLRKDEYIIKGSFVGSVGHSSGALMDR